MKKRSAKKNKTTLTTKRASRSLVPKALLGDVRSLILTARQHVAREIDSSLVKLYWSIGRRIHQDILQEQRAEFGQKIVQTLSAQLAAEFGQGFSTRNLWYMVRFAETYPDQQIVQTLSAQLGWSHFCVILPCDDELQRDFYAEMCRIERWSVRTLRQKIDSMLFERTALSKKPQALIRQELDELRDEDKLTPDLVFRDPYLLDFLGLKDCYLEKDVENAIVNQLERFILELGDGFAFIERQKRISVDGDDHYLDLLFYHRGLRRLVAIDIKLRDFQPIDKGQMEFYLRWLDKHERQECENAPLGLILCAGKKHETIELMELDKSNIRVASYWTQLLPRELLERKLHEAVVMARERMARQESGRDVLSAIDDKAHAMAPRKKATKKTARPKNRKTQ